VGITAPPPIPIPPVVRTVPPPPPAPPPPPRAAVITQPDWLRRPDAEDMARYYPDRAQRLNKAGSAKIECTVTANGSLTGCSVISEEPADLGFGESSVSLSKLFKMKPKTVDGAAVGGATVIFTIRFQLPQDE
jgi:protein TonB